MKTTRLFLTTLLLTFTGVLGMYAQNEPYCAIEEGVNQGELKATFYYDNLRSSRAQTVDVPDDYGMVEIPVSDDLQVIFDSSFANYRPTNTAYWFYWLQARHKISFYGWENLNTSEVTIMDNMFYALGHYENEEGERGTCEIENLDLSFFNTSKVTNMQSMFCYVHVDKLDISSFTINPNTVTDGMMSQCEVKRITLPSTAYNLADNAFLYTGTLANPCTLIYPNDFNPNTISLGNQVVNGDCEDTDATCLIGYGFDGDEKGFYTEFDDGAGYNGSQCVRVHSVATAQNQWDTMFFVYTPDHVWQAGDYFRFRMKVRADKASFVTVQSHGNPSYYIYYQILKNSSYEIGTDWNEIYYEGVITENQAGSSGMQAIAFMLNINKEDNNFYFDDISWEPLELGDPTCFTWKGGTFKDGPNKNAYAVLSRDARTLTFYKDNDKSTRTSEGKVYELNEGNDLPGWLSNGSQLRKVVFDPSFADARPTSTCYWMAYPEITTIEGLDYLNTSEVTNMSNMFYNSKPTYLDLSRFVFNPKGKYQEMLSNCSELKSLTIPATANYLADDACTGVGTTQEPCWLNHPEGFITGPYYANGESKGSDTYIQTLKNETGATLMVAQAIDGVGFNGSSGYKVQTSATAVNEWDTQFFITTGRVWNTGDHYRFKMKIRADKDAEISVQSHKQPTQYVCFNMLGNHYDITTEWQEIEYEGVITAQQAGSDGIQTIAFMLNKLKQENNFYFDDISWEPVYFNSEGKKYFQWKGGYFYSAQPYALLSDDCKTLTFYLNDNRPSVNSYDLNTLDKNGNSSLPGWYSAQVNGSNVRSLITTVVFDDSFSLCHPTTCNYWFASMSKLTSIIDIQNLQTDHVEDMSYMFRDCTSLTDLDVSHFDTSKAKTMTVMFYNCRQLKNLDVSNFDTSNVTTMTSMFNNCSSLESLDVSHFNTEKVLGSSMNSMFNNCSSLESLDLSSFTIVEGDNKWMARNCTGLKQLKIPVTANNLPSDAFLNVGASSPCQLDYAKGFTPDDATWEDGLMKWKGGYFKDFQLGDVNMDGIVSVADITYMVDYIVGTVPVTISSHLADMNHDNIISVGDVTLLVDLVVNNISPSAP